MQQLLLRHFNPLHGLALLSCLLLVTLPGCGPRARAAKKHASQSDLPRSTVRADLTDRVQVDPTMTRMQQKKVRRQLRRDYHKKADIGFAKNMTTKELTEAKEAAIRLGNTDAVIRYYEQMLSRSDEREDIRDICLQLADIYFERGELKKAAILYERYADEYRGSPDAEYAEYRAILACFYSTLVHQRDQSLTAQTIKLADTFLERADLYRSYKQDVNLIKNQCHEKLFEKEADVFDFYLGRKKLNAAEKRLAYMEDHFGKSTLKADPRITECHIRLADAKGNKDEVERLTKEMHAKYPDDPATIRVAQLHRRTPFGLRF